MRHGAFAAASVRATDPAWSAIAGWARELVDTIALDQTAQHISVFVHEPDQAQLRLAAQVWGAGEDLGVVVVGDWIVPIDGSVMGRVVRTGTAALCADVNLDPDYRPFPGGRSRSCLTVPVGPADRVTAVINIEAPWPAAFSIRDYEDVTARAAAAEATFPVRAVNDAGAAVASPVPDEPNVVVSAEELEAVLREFEDARTSPTFAPNLLLQTD